MLSINELKGQIQAIGADSVGVAGIDSPLLKEHGEEPEKLLPGVIGIARKLIGADEKTIKGVIYSSDFWDIWQSTVSGSTYNCSECMASCPIGSD
jgi:hypothetical protein